MVLGVVPSKSARKAACNTAQAHFRQQKAELSAISAHKPPNVPFPGSSSSKQSHAGSMTPGSAISNFVAHTRGRKTGNERLSRTALRDRIQAEKDEHLLRMNAMSTSEREALKAVCAPFEAPYIMSSVEDDDSLSMDPLEVLNGNITMDISHAGGEFNQLLSIGRDLFGVSKTKVHDYRTRRNRVEIRNMAFNAQMDALVDSYMTWLHVMGQSALSGEYNPPTDGQGQHLSKLLVMDTYYSRQVEIRHIAADKTVVASIIRHGYIPCSPLRPSVAFTVRTLQMYQTARNCCPHLSIHAFVKTLCDLYQKPFKRSLSRQFSICLDLYLELRRRVNTRVMAALQRDSPDWRLKHACAACTYTLKDEKPLRFKMLYTVDGNDSLKRIARREAGVEYDEETNNR